MECIHNISKHLKLSYVIFQCIIRLGAIHSHLSHQFQKFYHLPPFVPGKVGITVNGNFFFPQSNETENITAAERAQQFEVHNFLKHFLNIFVNLL